MLPTKDWDSRGFNGLPPQLGLVNLFDEQDSHRLKLHPPPPEKEYSRFFLPHPSYSTTQKWTPTQIVASNPPVIP